MWFQILPLLLVSSWTEGSAPEIHSLEYIYTALSKPVAVPGIYEFSAMGILDDKEIDYYNSKNKVKIPRQNWMSERLDKNYWEKGTQSRKSKEQWFKVNIDILMNRMNHNKSDVHVLQWKHGCQGVRQPDGSLKFQKGFDLYSYDGEDFLSFDDSNSQWVAPVTAAEATKRKWDGSQTLNQYTKGYLQKECMDWLSKFMTYGEVELKKYSSPKIFVFAKKSKNPGNLFLHCLATEFYPKDVVVEIYRNGVDLKETDGVVSTGVRPNGVKPHQESPYERSGETFQLKKSVEILENDAGEYGCRVEHRTLTEPVHRFWDRTCSDCKDNKTGIIAGVIVIILLGALGGIVSYLYKRGIIGGKGKEKDSTSSGSSKSSKNTKEDNPLLTVTVKNKTQNTKDNDSGHGSSSNSIEGLNEGRSSPEGNGNSSNSLEEHNTLMGAEDPEKGSNQS